MRTIRFSKIRITLVICVLLTMPVKFARAQFDYFTNNWNVAGLKDYPRGARITPENAVCLNEAHGIVEIRFGTALELLSRKQGKLAYDGWMPIMLVNTAEGPVQYDFTIWATPLPDVKDWKKAFDWPTEGENFAVWIKYRITNNSDKAARARMLISQVPNTSSGTHLVDANLAPGQVIEEAARYPFVKVNNPTPLLKADYKLWLQRTIDWWNAMKNSIASIEVPEKKATDALKAAHVCQMIANDLGEVRGGEGFYDEFYIRDGAYQVMELEEAGMWEAARKSVELYLPRQLPDGRFESHTGQFDANGQAQWVLWQYARITADRPFLERVYPAMKKAADWTIKTLRETRNNPDYPGLLPAALADGEYLWAGKNHIVGYDFWNLRGMLSTADAARQLGKTAEAADIEREATTYRAAIDEAVKKTGLPHFPPSWEQAGTHWGNTETLWPTPIFSKNDTRVNELIRFLRNDFGGGYHEGTIRWTGYPDVIHPYMGAYTTMADLILGNDERVVEDFYWYLLHSSAAHGFPEGIFFKSNMAWGHTIPHVTGACNYAIMLRHMLVHEDGTELHLLRAIPDWWLEDGRQIRISRLPTWFGEVSMTITGRKEGVEVNFDGPVREKPSNIILHLPENRKLLTPAAGVAVELRKPQPVKWDFNKVVGLYEASQAKPETTLRFGVMTDVHQDIMHDASTRVKSFVRDMTAAQPDFIIQLGDFCQPVAKNLDFLNLYNSYPGEKYHVLGNHDMDGGFKRDSTVAFYHAKGRYYSFNKNGFHLVVLDANEVNPSPDKAPGYARYIGKEQQEWLAADLKKSRYPSVLFSHQPLNGGIENTKEILSLLKDAGKANPAGRVVACFNGHDHADVARQVDGIWFVQVNSMSYDWLGDPYAHNSYPDSIHKNYPYIQYTAPYQDPLWAMVTLSSSGKIAIKGRKSAFVGPSPADLKHPGKGNNTPFSSSITDTVLYFE